LGVLMTSPRADRACFLGASPNRLFKPHCICTMRKDKSLIFLSAMSGQRGQPPEFPQPFAYAGSSANPTTSTARNHPEGSPQGSFPPPQQCESTLYVLGVCHGVMRAIEPRTCTLTFVLPSASLRTITFIRARLAHIDAHCFRTRRIRIHALLGRVPAVAIYDASRWDTAYTRPRELCSANALSKRPDVGHRPAVITLRDANAGKRPTGQWRLELSCVYCLQRPREYA